MKKLFLLMLFIVPATGTAQSIDMNVSNDSFRFTYAYGVGGNLVTDLGLLYLQEKRRYRDDELAFHAGLNITSGNVRFGGRAFLVSPGNTDIFAVGFGGQARFAVSRVIGFGGHFYYAPEVTSFLDAEGYYEYEIKLDFKASNSAYLYVGYRNVKIKIGDRSNKVELDDDVMVGFKVFF